MQSKHRLLTAAMLVIGLAVGAYFWLRPEAPVPGELPRAALVLTDGRLCLKDSGLPFTGTVFEQTGSGQRLSELTVREGILHGMSKGWYDSGAQEVEEQFVDGKSNGVRKRWHANGKLKNEATIVNGELHGPYTEWHDDGSMAARMNMVHGKGEGLCEAWHRGGAPKAKVILAAGEPVTKEYFDAPAALTANQNLSEAGEAAGK